MKKTGRLLSLALIVLMVASMSFSFCFADGETGEDTTGETATSTTTNAEGMTTDSFSLVDTYPKDGATGTSIENLGVKLYFDSIMTSDVIGDDNSDCITFTDSEGNKLPTRVLYSPSEAGVVLVLIDTEKLVSGQTIKGNTEYSLKISGDFHDNHGNTLGEDQVVKFTTLNQTRNSIVNMVLMFVMMGGMMVFSMKGIKKEAEKDGDNDSKEKKQVNPAFNPYKEAKRTGKSVEEVIAAERTERAKQAEKEAKKAAKEAAEDAKYDDVYADDWMEEGHYKAGKPRTVASAGSTYITGRKALHEEKLRKEAERKALEEKWAKNSKKKGKKK